MQILGISRSAAYKLMRQINSELEKKGYIVIRGKVSRKYFEERIYGSVSMTTGKKYNSPKGNWKNHLQPITNKYCDELGLSIMSAEYSRNPKNISRDKWEREMSMKEIILRDAKMCAYAAGNVEYFKYLMKRLGYVFKKDAWMGKYRHRDFSIIISLYAADLEIPRICITAPDNLIHLTAMTPAKPSETARPTYNEDDYDSTGSPVALTFEYGLVNDFLSEWCEMKTKLNNGEISSNEYFEWKITWPQA